MKNPIILVVAVAFGTHLRAEEIKPKLILKCEGFSRNVNGPISHIVEIYDDYAVLDGRKKYLKQTPTYYGLFESEMMDREVPTHDIFSIDRITGAYDVFDASKNMTQASDWSRPTDSGCTKAIVKF